MRARCVIFCNAPPAKAGCLRFVAFMTGRRPQRVAYHFAPSHRGTTTKWAVSLASDLESDSSQQPCTLHGKPAYPYTLLSVRRPVPPPLLLLPVVTEYIPSLSNKSRLRVSCESLVSRPRTLRLFCKLTSPAIVLFKTFDYYQGKSSRSFFVRLTFDARYVDGDRDVHCKCSRQ